MTAQATLDTVSTHDLLTELLRRQETGPLLLHQEVIRAKRYDAGRYLLRPPHSHGHDWSDSPPKGEMFIWARRNPPDRHAPIGVGYWTVSGGWQAAAPSAPDRNAFAFHPMPSPPPEF